MHIINQIGAVLSGITGAAAILGSLFRIWKWVKKILDEAKAIRADIGTLQKHTKENYMCNLRLTIMSEEMPIEERLKAGEEYVNRSGNGAVKCKYKELQDAYLKNLREEC